MLRQLLLGKKSASGSAIPERCDVNGDFIINESDITLLRSIILHTTTGKTLTYTSSKDDVTIVTPLQYEFDYIKYDAKTGNELANYNIPIKEDISPATSRSIINEDDRYIDYSQSGVVLLYSGNKVIGTGFIVDGDKIVTAAHVVFDTTNDIPVSDLKYVLYNSNGQKIDINGNVQSDSYTGINADSYHISDKYFRASSYGYNSEDGNGRRFDYALIKVNQDLSKYQCFNIGLLRNGIANTDTTFYVTGYNTANPDTNKEHSVSSEFAGKIVTGSGVLCDTKGLSGSLGSKIGLRNIFYNIDIMPGESGGPVYTKNSDGSKTVVGINTGSAEGFNIGTRFNTRILSFIFENPQF